MRVGFVFPGPIGVTEDTPASSVRVLLTAVTAYEQQYNALPLTLSSLGPSPSGQATRDAANLIDARLASGNKSGYLFRYVPNAASKSFFIAADPGDGNASIHFFADQTGVLRVESGYAASEASQVFYDND